MRNKAKYGIISFILIMSAIGIAWWINYAYREDVSNGANVTLEDSIRKGKEIAKIKQDSARKADSVYTVLEGDLKWMIDEINNNTPTAAKLRDSLREVLKTRAYADSVRYANRR